MQTFQNLAEFYHQAAQRNPDGIAFVFPSPDFNQHWTWMQVWELGVGQAKFLESQGIVAGDRVGIHARSSWQWEVAQLAVFILGATVVGIDPNEPEGNFEKIRSKTQIKAILVNEAYLREKWRSACGDGPLVFDLVESKVPIPQSWSRGFPSPHDEALIVFTSGTTSEPKGILYSHEKVIYAVTELIRIYPEGNRQPRVICWLPLANLFQRMANFGAIFEAGTIYFVENPVDVISCLPKIKPQIFISVPRFYEKIYDSVILGIQSAPGPIRYFLKLGLFLARIVWHLEQKKDWAGQIRWLLSPWEILLFKKIRFVFGGKIELLISGSAPMRRDLLLFYHSIGLPVVEAYGTSENVVPVAANTKACFRLGSVGKPVVPDSVYLSEEGEVLVKGKGLFSGYMGVETEYIDKNGFYHTGDLGYFDEDGFLFLNGRRTEMFKTTTGKKVSLAEIETHFKGIPFIDQVVVVGEGRKHPLVLLTMDFMGLSRFLKRPLDAVWDASSGSLDGWTSYKIEEVVRSYWKSLGTSVKPAGALIMTRKLNLEQQEVTLNLKIRRKAIERRLERSFDQLQTLTEEDYNFPILFLGNENKATEEVLPTSIIDRGSILVKSTVQMLFAYANFLLGGSTKSQYYRRVGQFLRISLGTMRGPMQKLGQMLSHLSEDFPEEIREELGQLMHDSQPVNPFLIRTLVESELRKPIPSIFSEWNDDPISSASIGQVHWARLVTGEEVAVKVLLPGVEMALRSDLRMLKVALPILKKILNFDSLPYHFRELEQMFYSECDLTNEAKNFKVFSKIHQQEPQIIVPKVFESISTPRVLVTEFIQAENLDDWSRQASQDERNRMAQIIWTTASRSINLYAQFNADPHPGNFLVKDDKLVLVDFGFCKKWEPHFIINWKKQVLAGCDNQLNDFIKYSKELGMVHNDPSFYKDLLAVYQEIIYEPWLRDQDFYFTHKWVKSYLVAITKYHISNPGLKLSPEFLALSRLYWGMFGVMARIEAKGNFYQSTIPYIKMGMQEIPK